MIIRFLPVLLALVLAAPAQAATFSVTTTADAVDAAVGDGICATAAGACSLRAAVQEANADLTEPHTIAVPAGTYQLVLAGTDESAAAGDLDLFGAVTLTGAGSGSTILDGNGIDRILDVGSGASLTLSGVTVRGGSHGGIRITNAQVAISSTTITANVNDGHGGGIEVGFSGNPSLSLTGVEVSGNIATAGFNAGGISVGAGSIAVTGSTIRDNTAAESGGGLTTGRFVSLTVTGSVLSGNTASGQDGGAIHANSRLAAVIRSSEISGNSAAANGGGIATGGEGSPLTIENSTISGNSAGSSGGGIAFGAGTGHVLHHATISGNTAAASSGLSSPNSGTITAKNTIVAGNSAAGGGECGGFGDPAGQGHNLEDEDGGCGFDIVGAPGLLALAANGGGSRTHALVTGSPAVDAGSDCALATDQRGTARPVGAGCDLGAYEGALAVAAPTLTVSAPSGVPLGGGVFTVTASAFNGTGAALEGVSLELQLPAGLTVAAGTSRTLGALADAGTGSASWTVTSPDRCLDETLELTVRADWSGRSTAIPEAVATVAALGRCATLAGIVRDPGGVGALGATVELCRIGSNGQPGEPCLLATTGALGTYAITGIEPDTYRATVRPDPDGPGSGLPPLTWGNIALGERGNVSQDFGFSTLRTAGTATSFENARLSPQGTPTATPRGTKFRYSEPTCDGATVTWLLIQGIETIASGTMSLVNAGVQPPIYEGEIPPLTRGGWMELRITKACPGGATGGVLIVDIYIDPSGWVRDQTGAAVPGATVSLYKAPAATGPWTLVPDGSTIMSPNNRVNPDLTDPDGHFGWDVVTGWYKVVAEKAGCGSVESRVMFIPPPVFDLDLRLSCTLAMSGAAGVATTPAPAAVAIPVGPTTPTVPFRLARAGAFSVRRGDGFWRVRFAVSLSSRERLTVTGARFLRGSRVGAVVTGKARGRIFATASAPGVVLELRVRSRRGAIAVAAGGRRLVIRHR